MFRGVNVHNFQFRVMRLLNEDKPIFRQCCVCQRPQIYDRDWIADSWLRVSALQKMMDYVVREFKVTPLISHGMCPPCFKEVCPDIKLEEGERE